MLGEFNKVGSDLSLFSSNKVLYDELHFLLEPV